VSFEREVSLTTRALLRATCVAAVVLSAHALCRAQAGGTPIVGTPHVDPAVERIRDEQQRQMALRSGGRRAEDPHADERAVKAAAEQLNQDFKRVQVIRNDIARAVTSGSALDYGRVSEEASEVRKRSLRMQTVLALREGKDADKQKHEDDAAYDEARLKEALVQLCHRIDSFVANPRFKSPGVVDVDATAKAARDLREMIDLSQKIKGGAERLGHRDK
jgi:hypothetical protein